MKQRVILSLLLAFMGSGLLYSQNSTTKIIYVEADEIVITATKSKKSVKDIPGRTEWINAKQMKSLPSQQIDEYLSILPGIMINRDHGFLSHSSSVSMRGLGGDQQGRFLVLLNGSPMNKADGGSVNWNGINPLSIERIEVAKGPMSSLYGGNAMGGVIQLIERKARKKFEGSVSAEYGSMNTKRVNAWLGGNVNPDGNGLYWMVNAFTQNSEGFMQMPEEERDSTDVSKYMNEWSAKAAVGYRFNNHHTVEFSSGYWDDKRGSGTKIYAETGTYFGHKVWTNNVSYQMTYPKTHLIANLYNNNEDYLRLNESLKVSNGVASYTAYDVTSIRQDQGMNLHGDYSIGFQQFSLGMDLKQGGVIGKDVYSTSTDVVTNQGKMNTLALYAQDAIRLFDDRFHVIAGLRFDQARFFDGAFTLTDPTNATSILEDLVNPALDTYNWMAFSPKLAVKYQLIEALSMYASYGHGFRPSILDDLCRSGFVSGGFKKANPNLEPEKLDNFEAGFDLSFNPKMKFTGTAYYSEGKDFIYLVSTGDFIAMGTKMKPIKEARNITAVEIYGAEAGLRYTVSKGLSTWVNYAYNHSEILEYTNEDGTDLSGKELIYSPSHLVNAGISWANRICNFSVQGKWISQQWMDDGNEEFIAGHVKIDAKVSKEFKSLGVFVKGNNLSNVVYIEGHGQLSLGRYISGGISYNF